MFDRADSKSYKLKQDYMYNVHLQEMNTAWTVLPFNFWLAGRHNIKIGTKLYVQYTSARDE